MPRLILLAATLALLAATAPAQAASTARASAVPTLRSAPASYAPAVGRLATYTVASARPGSGPIVVIP